MASSAPTIEQVMNDPATSNWLKQALEQAIQRDPVDAANDASLLHALLDARLKEILLSE